MLVFLTFLPWKYHVYVNLNDVFAELGLRLKVLETKQLHDGLSTTTWKLNKEDLFSYNGVAWK